MPYRWTNIRTVEPSVPHDNIVHQPFSLWWAALAASDETMQGGPLVPAWLRLFSTHLSTADQIRLRWGGDLAQSAELRRAYSALYGRYFSRALLASRLGLTDFVSLRTNKTRLPNGIVVERTLKGDIPDWIAWNPAEGAYSLCEAKGSLTGRQADFMTGQPACIRDGKRQFGRVQVLDRSGRALATRNWVAANLWSTDGRPRESVSLLWDPPADGTVISEGDRQQHADGMRRRRIANIALRLGRPALLGSARRLGGALLRVTAKPDGDGMPTKVSTANEDELLRPIERPAGELHEGTYAAAMISAFGIRSVVTSEDVAALMLARKSGEPAMLFGLSVDSLRADQAIRRTWLSGQGIAAPDGLSLFDLHRVEIDV
ncbi:hypothetical protein [Sphingomonas bisphenolicum]|uniref:Uncharacterized protein n=1 Tax=Sphingomonas bisphenolicum TaxID=296544 RepID=A0ABM7G590_9SPHN|nr:hypothetical protein [Sphingomonas bisphenolicum]BBF69773.1 hypothetical protein SBA_ch1_19730 [Sphingomonas bisphenolicum]